ITTKASDPQIRLLVLIEDLRKNSPELESRATVRLRQGRRNTMHLGSKRACCAATDYDTWLRVESGENTDSEPASARWKPHPWSLMSCSRCSPGSSSPPSATSSTAFSIRPPGLSSTCARHSP